MALKGENCGNRSLGEEAGAVAERERGLKENKKPGALGQKKLET